MKDEAPESSGAFVVRVLWTMPPVSVTRTYLELASPADHLPAETPVPEPSVERLAEYKVPHRWVASEASIRSSL